MRTTKQQKAKAIAGILDEYYPDVDAPLEHVDPYTLLVAVILSARCTDARVNLTTPVLFKKADNPKKMAALKILEIQKIIQPCGLSPQKAKNIHRMSEILLEKYKGKVPKTFEELEELPGVGHKTASVVMSQAFDVPAFPVDTHIHRLARRWGLSSGKNVEQTERDLKELFPESAWNKVHLQMIYFGREYCPARGHKKEACPICKKYGVED